MKIALVYYSPRLIDHKATGIAAKFYRQSKRVKAKEVSGKMEILASEITRLEQGKSKWTQSKLDEYIKAVDSICKTPMK